MAIDLVYSVRMGYLDRGVAERILGVLDAVGFRLWDDAVLERDTTGGLALVAGLQEFREHLGGELHITLLRGIGDGFEVTSMDERIVRRSIDELAARAARRRSGPRSPVAAPRGR